MIPAIFKISKVAAKIVCLPQMIVILSYKNVKLLLPLRLLLVKSLRTCILYTEGLPQNLSYGVAVANQDE